MRTTFAKALLASVLLLGVAACGGEREAEATTANAEAEVTTTAPESVIPNEALNDAAVNAVTAADPAGAPFVSEGAGGTTATAPGNATGQ